MAACHKKVELTIAEIEPASMSNEEHERKTEAALDAFSIMACKEINKRREKEGKSLVTDRQAREIVLYWAKKR